MVLASVTLLVTGCGMDEMLVSKKEEIELGRQTAEHLEAEKGLCRNQELATEVNGVGHAIVDASGCTDYEFEFKVLDDDTLNACACPGGFVFINKGMAETCGEDELAAVVGHEVAHVVRRHSVNQLLESYGVALVLRAISGEDISDIEAIAATVLQCKFSREDEDEADRLGQKYAFLAGYDPLGMVQLHERIKEEHGNVPSVLTWINSHPSPRHRIWRARSNLVQLYLKHGDRRPRSDRPTLALLVVPGDSGLADAVTSKNAQAIAKKLSQTGLADVRALDMSLYSEADCTEVASSLGCDGVLRVELSEGQAEAQRCVQASLALEALKATASGFSSSIESDTYDAAGNGRKHAVQQLEDAIVGELIWKLM